jgi:hypothetical protein
MNDKNRSFISSDGIEEICDAKLLSNGFETLQISENGFETSGPSTLK